MVDLVSHQNKIIQFRIDLFEEVKTLLQPRQDTRHWRLGRLLVLIGPEAPNAHVPKVAAPRQVEEKSLDEDDGRWVRVVVELDVAATFCLAGLGVLGNMDAEFLLLTKAILDEEREMTEENLPVDTGWSISLRRTRERGKRNIDVEGLVVL